MARNSLVAAKAELYGLLSGANLPSGVTAAYAFEPYPGQAAKPTSLTVSIISGGMDPDFYQLALRIYQTTDVDAETAENTLAGLILDVESRLTSGFGVSTWAVDYLADIDALVATCIVPVGREDPY